MDQYKSLPVRWVILVFLALSVSFSVIAEEADPHSPPLVININTADADVLSSGLKGVGQKRAQDIVAWRETHGAFSSIEQLLEVKGIGPKVLDSNRAVLQLK